MTESTEQTADLRSRAQVRPRVTRITAAAKPATPAPTAAPAAPALSALGLFTVLLGASLPLIDFFIVNVALPTISADLHASASVLELVVAGYGVAYAVLLVLGGRLGDMFGRRRLFLAGMAAFGVTSLACGLAPSAWALVGARVAQGAAAALMMPQVLATVHSATSGKRHAKAISLYGATAGLSMVAGQILGGVLVAADIAGTDWRAVFLVNVPVVVAALALAVRTVPETRSARPAPVDGPGTVLLAVTLVTLLAPLTEGRAAGWPVWTWLSLGAFPLAAAAFYAVERQADRAGRTPLVPPSLFELPGMRRALPMLLPFATGFGGFMFVVAVAMQEGLHYGPVTAGLALTPLAAAFFVASLAGPRLVGRYGSRVITAGGVLQGVGLAVLALTVARDWSGLSTLDLVPALTLAGFGQGLQLPLLMRFVLTGVPAERAGVGSGVMVTTQQTSLALGVATLGTLFLSLAPGHGMRDALVAVLLVQVAGVVLTTVMSLRLRGMD